MAVTFVGSDKADASSGTTLTFASYPTTQADDVGIIIMYNDQDLYTHSIGTATGWTKLVEQLTSGGRDMHTSVWWKRLTSSESTPVPTKSSSTDEFSATVHIFRGGDTVFDPQFAAINAQNIGGTAGTPTDEHTIPGPLTPLYASAAGLYAMCLSHDDITAIGTPTGYTLGETITGSTKDFRQQTVAYDLDLGTVAAKTPPPFGHTYNNTVCEFHGYFVVLENNQPIHLTSPADLTKYNWSDTNKTVGGDGFGATQSTGKLELWSDESGTTKVSQSIDTWSDTSIQFDLTQGSLVDGINYLVVTNSSSEESNKVPVNIGFGPYQPWTGTDADHYWQMDNAYTDEAKKAGNDRPFNNVQTGTPDFVTSPLLCRTNTYSFRINSDTEHSEVADSPYTNVTNAHNARNVGGWIRVANNRNIPGVLYEEGGGVNNIYLMVAPNGRLIANIADEGDFKAQCFADFPLQLDRAYHVMIDWKASPTPHFHLWIDGVQQSSSLAGSLGTKTTMATHGGDWSYGQPDANLDTGGVDIAYPASATFYLAHWGTWSNTGGGALLTTTQIRDDLFRYGALAEHTISSGTESAMQTSMDSYDTQTHADVPLTYEIEDVTGSGALELTLTDQVWPDEVKFQVRWLGSSVLTIRNSGTSNFVTSKAWSPVGGTFAVIETAPVKVTVKNINTGAAIVGARVLLEADTGGPLSAGADIIDGETGAGGVIETEIDYTSSQPVVGKVREGDSPYYRQANIVGTVVASGLDLTVFVIPDA